MSDISKNYKYLGKSRPIIEGLENVFFYVIMFILIFFTHRENIKRLKNKEETKTKIY